MIQQTVNRLLTDLPAESLMIITNGEQAEAMRKQLPLLKAEQVVAEPCGRDTAACIGLAAFIIRKSDPDGVMAVLSADHLISPPEEMTRCIREGARIASDHAALVTFGIKPTGPRVEYGYIRRGEALTGAKNRGLSAFKIAEFKEKPDRAQAEQFMSTGEYYWNSGNFVWRVSDIVEAIRRYLPELYEGLEKIEAALGTPEQDAIMADEYPRLPRISIDYGVMERSPNAAVVEATFEWDDVGSWESIARHYPADEHGNVVTAEHMGIDTGRCILVGGEGHLLATLGVRDLIIVHTPDATLVCDRSRAPEVKELVNLIGKAGLHAYL